ncbi:MAG: ATP-binding protein [Verrucomicrobia bacterium]|nr:ATP-binding protein [Verrucomicrobiota bacterium]MDE3099338.1 ATP-binding protein [Verrucomicrobiota bacterium]
MKTETLIRPPTNGDGASDYSFKLFGDAVRLQQVFWNVLKNAVKFTSEKGSVTIKTACENDSISIKISDTGIGMSQELNGAPFQSLFAGRPRQPGRLSPVWRAGPGPGDCREARGTA